MSKNKNQSILENLIKNKCLIFSKPTLIKALSEEIGKNEKHFYRYLKNDKQLIESIKLIHLLTDFKVGSLIGFDKDIDTLLKEFQEKELAKFPHLIYDNGR